MTKTISLADDAYEALSSVRLPGESFSDVARRLARKDADRFLFDPALRVELSRAAAAAWTREIYAERDRSTKPRVALP